MEETVLEYVGEDKRFVIGVPARNLTETDIKEIDYTEEQLINSGVYRQYSVASRKRTYPTIEPVKEV